MYLRSGISKYYSNSFHLLLGLNIHFIKGLSCYSFYFRVTCIVCNPVIALHPGSRRHTPDQQLWRNLSMLSRPSNLGDLSSLNFDLKCHMNGDTISALHSFPITSCLTCAPKLFTETRFMKLQSLTSEQRSRLVCFFLVMLHIGRQDRHPLQN